MNIQRTMVLLMGGMAMSQPVLAEEKNWYVTAELGLNLLGDQDLDYRVDGALVDTVQAGFGAGFAGGARVGRYLNDRWRLEGEVLYRTSSLDNVSVMDLGASTGGDFSSLGYGLSALYEFNWFGSERYRSYVGAGVVFIQEIDIDFEIGGVETSFETDDIAGQLQAGVRIGGGERWFADLGVRYLAASSVDLELPADGGQVIRADYDPLTITLGAGWRF
ncbi:MAG: OmpW family outer membrane protein [Pseudomonadota bacterium]